MFRRDQHVRRAMLEPMAAIATIAFFSIAVIGLSVVYSARTMAVSIYQAHLATDLAHNLAQTIAQSQASAHDILAMTHMVSQSEVSRAFESSLENIENGIVDLTSLDLNGHLDPEIEALDTAMKAWADTAATLLGISEAKDIPAPWVLQSQAEEVQACVTELVGVSHAISQQAVGTFQTEFASGVIVTGTVALLLLAFVAAAAARSANQLSNALVGVSATLMDLAGRETDRFSGKQGELSSMHAALNVLRNSMTEKAQISQQLVHQNQRAEEALQIKSRFLANMSHEIRTPINGILGMAEVLETTELDAEQKECSATILTASEALLAVINSILDFSKNESGQTSLVREPFLLDQVVYDVATLLGPNASQKAVEIVVDYPEATPAGFCGDALRLRQILMNLVGNAVKFTQTGFVSIRVRYDETASLPLTISVKDTGVGIPEDRLDDIFVAFQQVDMRSTRKFDGTGLGLAITKQLVDLMSGTITATSDLGDGAEFSVALNLPKAEIEIDADPDPAVDKSAFASATCLIVDDLAINRKVLANRLAAWGVRVTQLDSAAALMSAMQALPDLMERFDFAVFDYNMPDMDGVALGELLRDQGCLENCPTILYSSSDVLADLAELKKTTFADVLMKPARSEAMARVIAKILAAKPVAPPPSIALPQAPGSEAEQTTLSGARILVAEDNATNRLVVKKMLAKTPHEVRFSENGKLALDSYISEGADIIFMDMSMPTMDGLTATREIRKYEEGTKKPPCPIVALTANALREDRDACAAAGMDDYLTKPVRRAELLSAIDRHLPDLGHVRSASGE